MSKVFIVACVVAVSWYALKLAVPGLFHAVFYTIPVLAFGLTWGMILVGAIAFFMAKKVRG